ncbi:MAG: SGNH/GDSL hydrolase family protein [Victivallaceae bacterium]|nr:SGNH/GDSL hydrolase family protein [Victivallaceae bacterium]
MYELFDRVQHMVLGESVLFEEGRETVYLALPAERIVRCVNRMNGAEFTEGRDFAFDPERGALRRLPGSRLPLFPAALRYPKRENAIFFPAPGANALESGEKSPTGLCFYAEGAFFAGYQAEIDYVTSAALPEAESTAGKLPGLRRILDSGRPLCVAFVGDSITNGSNASARVGAPPYQPPYAGLVAQRLSAVFSQVRMNNSAVGGTASCSGVEQLEKCLSHMTPDVLFIAFGMNELLAPAENYRANLVKIMETATQANPAMEFVLVSPMCGNQDWKLTPPEKSRELSAVLRELAAAQGRSYASVNEFCSQMTHGKNFFDVTGNGVNHPNDFLHRVYAEAVWRALDLD